jgi:hypothetical protein
MGLIRKTFSIGLTGGLIGYRSAPENVARNIRLTAKATQQAAVEARRQTASIERQNELQIVLMQRQNELIEQQTAAIIRQREESIAQRAATLTAPVSPAADPSLGEARRTAFGLIKAHEEKRREAP